MIDRNQLRFGIALFFFLAWVGALAAMALVTANQPQAANIPPQQTKPATATTSLAHDREPDTSDTVGRRPTDTEN